MKTKTLLLWILAVLPLIALIFLLPLFPDSIPAHYGANGEIDRWGSKYELFIMPAVSLFTALMFWFFSFVEKRSKKHTEQNQKVLFVLGVMTVLMFDALSGVFFYLAGKNASGIPLNANGIYPVVSACLSLVLVILGNVMPKCKQNGLVGIRTPWTLSNEEVWYRTHRFGGIVMMATGTVLLPLSLFVLKGMWSLAAVLGALLLMTAVLVVYSYRIYKKVHG